MEIVLGCAESLLAGMVSYLLLYRLGNKIHLSINGVWIKCKLFYQLLLLGIFCNGFRYYKGMGNTDTIREAWLFVMMAALLLLGIYDYQTRKVPNQMLLGLLLIWVLSFAMTLFGNKSYAFRLLVLAFSGAIFSGCVFLLCYLITKGQLGGGDVKLAFVMGLYITGERIFGVIVIGVTLCLIYSLFQLFLKRMGWKDSVALVPFLCTGFYITLGLT